MWQKIQSYCVKKQCKFWEFLVARSRTHRFLPPWLFSIGCLDGVGNVWDLSGCFANADTLLRFEIEQHQIRTDTLSSTWTFVASQFDERSGDMPRMTPCSQLRRWWRPNASRKDAKPRHSQSTVNSQKLKLSEASARGTRCHTCGVATQWVGRETKAFGLSFLCRIQWQVGCLFSLGTCKATSIFQKGERWFMTRVVRLVSK